MKMIGLIGFPVEHSLSPVMQNAAFAERALDYHYILLPTPPEQLGERIRDCLDRGFAGWNITVPHKQAMLPYLDEMADEVRATGACNTVRVDRGRLTGFNTDIPGFLRGLDEAGGLEATSKAVLLGAGGAARAVAFALGSAGHPVTILSRRPEQAEQLAHNLSPYAANIDSAPLNETTLQKYLPGATLLVNCTPAGMWPRPETTPLPEGTRLHPNLLVYDLVYNPAHTRLLRQATTSGCRTRSGLSMLLHQGAAAFHLWTGADPPLDIMRQACEASKGMPSTPLGA